MHIPRLEIHNNSILLKLNTDEVISIPRLKHAAVFVMASYIARQYADCEYKIHLDYVKGRKIRSEMIEGLIEHSKQLKSRESSEYVDIDPIPGHEIPVLINVGIDGIVYFNNVLSSRCIFKLLNNSDNVIKEPAILAVIDSVPILAQPDIVIIERGNIRAVIELKTTKHDARRIHKSEIFQVSIYSYILSRINLKPKNSILIKVRRGSNIKIIDDIESILERCEEHREIHSRDISMLKVNINYENIENIIRWAIQYWTHSRNPEPKPGIRCRYCQHNARCPFSASILYSRR